MNAVSQWQCRDRALDLGAPVVMGVLNVTPNSFSDGGRFAEREAALRQARLMVAEGAAIIDIGGESTRPGAAPVALSEELARVIPIIEALRRESAVFISVDTSKPEVMHAACDAGADIINDIRALTAPDALAVAAGTRAGVCLMHMKGEPRTMQDAPHYDDVLAEVGAFLAIRVAACRAAGIDVARIAADPGFGFGKRVADNLALLKHFGRFEQLGVALAAGLSRKSMLATLTGRNLEQRTAGSVALAAIAVLNGARIVRAHDVAATVDAVRVAAAVAQGAGFDGT
ncbi:MAG TPA: dihydropteroate synthase [Steroidobacteraceae bacterium]|jgi:dihydropteroate synthase|nr:dihydropteroate synthase [Steroidobacteraceae bacterium]